MDQRHGQEVFDLDNLEIRIVDTKQVCFLKNFISDRWSYRDQSRLPWPAPGMKNNPTPLVSG